MLITLNQKEIEKMIIDGLVGMRILHAGDAKVNMIAGRSPNGMTAEVKFEPPEMVVVVDNRETFSGDREHPAPQATVDEEKSKTEDKVSTDEEPVKSESSLSGKAPLFGKDRNAESA